MEALKSVVQEGRDYIIFPYNSEEDIKLSNLKKLKCKLDEETKDLMDKEEEIINLD